jgi:hypothetical protein
MGALAGVGTDGTPAWIPPFEEGSVGKYDVTGTVLLVADDR